MNGTRVGAGALLALAACATPPSPALTLPLADAELFVPANYTVPADGRVPLMVHFQGGAKVGKDLFRASGRDGVLLASTLLGRSSAFAQPYRDPAVFRALLADGERQLAQRCGHPVTFAPIAITFWSAGYGAVREFLRHGDLFARIDALVAVDSIYADVMPDTRTPRPEQMAGFVAFARAAAAGQKQFVLAHSQIVTDYASTAETAAALHQALGLAPRPSTAHMRSGLAVATEAHCQGFHSYGFAGADARTHVDILHLVPELLRLHVD